MTHISISTSFFTRFRSGSGCRNLKKFFLKLVDIVNPVDSENNENKSNVMKDNPSDDSKLAFQIYLFVVNHDDVSFKQSIKPDSNHYHQQQLRRSALDLIMFAINAHENEHEI